MIQLHKGDTIAIVSLSRGLLGEDYAKHQLKRGKERLESLGLKVKYMSHSLKGIDYLESHPEKRAEDLIEAFRDSEVKGIICAIGGEDTYRLTPYLLTRENQAIIQQNPKFFMGYSDTTVNHLQLYKCGLNTFYGLSYITCFAELGPDLLPYSRNSFEHIFTDQSFIYQPSSVWYEERTDFSESQIDVPRLKYKEVHGYELLQGSETFSGHLLGGCMESLYDLMTGYRHPDEKLINDQYSLIPSLDEWKGAILFLENSEAASRPELLKDMLQEFKNRRILDQINGILVGKPQNERYYEEYKEVYRAIIPPHTPVLYNLNFGHAYPKMLLQYGAYAEVDAKMQTIKINRL